MASKEKSGLVEQLRDAIRRSGHSLNQLSQQCGVGRDRLSRFMRGERDLTLEAAEKVCRVLHFELSPYGPPAELPKVKEPPPKTRGRPRKEK
jgi:transcriptional regulator with XRE-family HTH domain